MLEFVHFGTVYAFFAEHRNGNTYTEKLFISVYTPQNNLDIITKSLKIKEEDLSIWILKQKEASGSAVQADFPESAIFQ